MKYLIILAISYLSITLSAQQTPLEQRLSTTRLSAYRYAHIGALSGTFGSIVGNAVAGKPGLIAGGTLASIASSLLVRSRTDSHTALITTASGLVCTAGLTIGLNKRKGKKRGSIECPF